LKDKKFKQKPSLKSYKTEIKINANPGLAQSYFEQPGADVHTDVFGLSLNNNSDKKKENKTIYNKNVLIGPL